MPHHEPPALRERSAPFPVARRRHRGSAARIRSASRRSSRADATYERRVDQQCGDSAHSLHQHPGDGRPAELSGGVSAGHQAVATRQFALRHDGRQEGGVRGEEEHLGDVDRERCQHQMNEFQLTEPPHEGDGEDRRGPRPGRRPPGSRAVATCARSHRRAGRAAPRRSRTMRPEGPYSIGPACSTVTAASGSATVVTAVPRPLVVLAAQYVQNGRAVVATGHLLAVDDVPGMAAASSSSGTFSKWNLQHEVEWTQPSALREDGLMRREDLADSDCGIAQSLGIIGDWQSLLIVREAAAGVTRFEGFDRELGLSRRALAERLARLVQHGRRGEGAVFRRIRHATSTGSQHPARGSCPCCWLFRNGARGSSRATAKSAAPSATATSPGCGRWSAAWCPTSLSRRTTAPGCSSSTPIGGPCCSSSPVRNAPGRATGIRRGGGRRRARRVAPSNVSPTDSAMPPLRRQARVCSA